MERNIPEISALAGVALVTTGAFVCPKPNIPAILAGLGMVVYGTDKIERRAEQSDSRTL